MNTNDWLTEIKEDLVEVIEDERVMTKGVVEELEDVEVSVTLTEQSDYFEAYVVAESSEIERAVDSVETVKSVIATEEHLDKTVATEKNERWSELHFNVSEERVRLL